MKNEILFLKALALMTCLLCAFSTMAQEAYAEYTDNDSTLTFYYDDLRSTRIGTTYDLNTEMDVPAWLLLWDYDDEWEESCSLVRKVVFDPSFADARPTSTNSWFASMRIDYESIIGIENLNTSEVIDMQYMFSECGISKLDLSSFNTEKVTNMFMMFGGCSDMKSLDLSSFNTEKVTNMGEMFQGCKNLTSLDLSSFDTRNVTNMVDMFGDCGGLTSLDLSGFNTANVTHMDAMFYYCSGLSSLDLSGFNTANVTDMSFMFYDCSNLSTIYTGNDWNTDRVTSSDHMFTGCTSLIGGMGTTYDKNHVDAEYAHIDGGPENPGYFTAAQAVLPGDVDGDGSVGISDVTTLIDYLLNSSTPIANEVADVDGNGNIDIADVTALIDLLLSGDN